MYILFRFKGAFFGFFELLHKFTDIHGDSNPCDEWGSEPVMGIWIGTGSKFLNIGWGLFLPPWILIIIPTKNVHFLIAYKVYEAI